MRPSTRRTSDSDLRTWILPALSGRTLGSITPTDVRALVRRLTELLTTIGALVLSVALIRARAIPVPAVITCIVLTLAQFAGLPGRTMDLLQIVMLVLPNGFAAVIWRRALR